MSLSRSRSIDPPGSNLCSAVLQIHSTSCIWDHLFYSFDLSSPLPLYRLTAPSLHLGSIALIFHLFRSALLQTAVYHVRENYHHGTLSATSPPSNSANWTWSFKLDGYFSKLFWTEPVMHYRFSWHLILLLLGHFQVLCTTQCNYDIHLTVLFTCVLELHTNKLCFPPWFQTRKPLKSFRDMRLTNNLNSNCWNYK